MPPAPEGVDPFDVDELRRRFARQNYNGAAYAFGKEGEKAVRKRVAAAASKPPQRPVHVETISARQLEGLTDDQRATLQTAVNLANKLNAYKEEYQGRISYNFRDLYKASQGLASLEEEYNTVYTLVNQGSSPKIVEYLAKVLVTAVRDVHMMTGHGSIAVSYTHLTLPTNREV